MSQVYTKVLSRQDAAASGKLPTDQPLYPPVVAVIWSLSAAFGVAFWILVLGFAAPLIIHEVPAFLHFIKHLRQPSAIHTGPAEAHIR